MLLSRLNLENIVMQLMQLDRMAKDCAVDLAKYNVAFVSLWPGIVKTELFEESLYDSSLTQKRATQVSCFI